VLFQLSQMRSPYRRTAARNCCLMILPGLRSTPGTEVVTRRVGDVVSERIKSMEPSGRSLMSVFVALEYLSGLGGLESAV